MIGVLTIAHLAFEEARRKRLLTAALLLATGYLIVFGAGLHFIRQDLIEHGVTGARQQLPLNAIVLAALYAANFLIVMVGALVGVDTLAGEIDSGAIDTLCTRPVSRSAVVLGKWLGCAMLLTVYATWLCGGLLLVARAIADFTPPGVSRGLPLILLNGLIMLTIALVAGTRLSALANGVTCLGLYGLSFLGGWTEQIGTLIGNAAARYIGIVASLIVPLESIWQLAAHHMQPSWMQQVNVTPFTPVSVPSPQMLVWAVGYLVASLLLAQRWMRSRDL